MKSIRLTLVMFGFLAFTLRGASTRTDINTALQYFQAFNCPDLSQADRDYLFQSDWRGQKLPDRFGEQVARYDNQFRLIRQAAQSTVPCDWGIDISAGPATLLPHLARCRGIAQAARARAMWYLQHGKQAEARDDLLAAFALARAGATVGICARRETKARELARAVGGEVVPRFALRSESFDAILNTTPVGMYPHYKISPLTADELNCRIVMDLIYRPERTQLLQIASEKEIATVNGVEYVTMTAIGGGMVASQALAANPQLIVNAAQAYQGYKSFPTAMPPNSPAGQFGYFFHLVIHPYPMGTWGD